MIIDRREKIRDALNVLFIIVFSYSVLRYFASLGMDAHHDGFMFKTALDLAHGKILYRDTYSQYGIIPSYIQALFILAFGERILSIRIATVVVYVLAFVINYLIWKRYLSRTLALILDVALVFMGPYCSGIFWFCPWPSVYSLFFIMLGVYCYILYLEKQNRRYMCMCALCSACAFLCRQPVGLVLVLAFYIMQLIFCWLSPDSKRTILKERWVYTRALCVIAVIFVAYLLISGSAVDYWIQNIEYMAKWGAAQSGSNASTLFVRISNLMESLVNCLLGKIWTGEYVWGLSALICVFHFWGKVLYCKKRGIVNQEDKCILMLNMYACASWHQYFPVPCFRHCYWGAFPMVGMVLYDLVMIYRMEYQGEDKKRTSKINATAMMLFLIIIGQVLWDRGVDIISKAKMNFQPVVDSGYDFLDGLQLTEEQIQFYYPMHKAIRSAMEETGKEVMNYSPHGYFAVFNNENYYKQYNNWGKDNVYSDYNEVAQKYIRENEPIIIAAKGLDIENYHVYFTSSGDIGNWVEPREISIYVHD